MPHMAAGSRIEPPTSEPMPRGEPRAAMSAPSPPLLPPQVRLRSCGLHLDAQKAVEPATLEAARLLPRGGGGAPSGWASLWECRAAQSRQARPEEAQGASWGAAKGGHFDRAGARRTPRRAERLGKHEQLRHLVRGI